MRRLAWFALALVIAAPSLTSAEDARRTISVTGTVETTVAPDQIVWSITLVDKKKNLREAKAANDEKVKSVVALREKLGAEEGDLETGQLNIHREYERDQFGNTGEFKNFVVTRSVTLRQRDLKRFDEFLEALVVSADMDVSFHFETSKIQEIRSETRLKALKAAMDKAVALSEVVGAKVGKVLSIDEHPSEGGRSSNLGISNSISFHSAPAADVATETFVPGAIRVQMTIYAVFLLE